MVYLITSLLLTSVLVCIFFSVNYLFNKTNIILGYREKFLFSALSLSTILLISLEILSINKQINSRNIWIIWASVLILLSIFLLSRKESIFREINNFSNWVRAIWQNSHSFEKMLLLFVIVLILILGFLGFVYPSNYSDSMTYHMPRVMHWAQNNSIAPYPTTFLRQISMPPFAEYHILNLFLLSGDDRLSAWVQWYFLFISIIGVSVIVKLLGGTRNAQLISVTFTVSLPAVLLQATGTQNDIAVAAWVIIAVSFLIMWMRDPGNLMIIICTGAAIGFAILTKATSYIFLAPFIIWAGIVILSKNKRFLLYAVLIGLIVISINFRYFSRNYQLFGSPLGPSRDYFNLMFTPASFASTLIRDMASNLRFTFSPNEVNTLSDVVLSNIHNFTGLQNNDQRITWYLKPTFFPITNKDILFEGYAPNPFHYLTIIIAVIITIFNLKNTTNQEKAFFVCLLAIDILYNSIMKFQLGAIRLHTTVFILWGAFLSKRLLANNDFPKIVFVFLVIPTAFWFIINDQGHPLNIQRIASSLTNRNDIYRYTRPYLFEDVDFLTDKIIDHNCSRIGIEFGSEVWEYPIWSFLQAKNYKGQIKHTYVRNVTKTLIESGYKPCAIFTNDKKRRREYPDSIRFKGVQYQVLIIK